RPHVSPRERSIARQVLAAISARAVLIGMLAGVALANRARYGRLLGRAEKALGASGNGQATGDGCGDDGRGTAARTG
ncbi:MAG TPA: hypothetical protein VJO13_18635, partial [Ktedonobacterales bacterium]|nr:hypothetical protein [Ktedonobacterales bacterium]